MHAYCSLTPIKLISITIEGQQQQYLDCFLDTEPFDTTPPIHDKIILAVSSWQNILARHNISKTVSQKDLDESLNADPLQAEVTLQQPDLTVLELLGLFTRNISYTFPIDLDPNPKETFAQYQDTNLYKIRDYQIFERQIIKKLAHFHSFEYFHLMIDPNAFPNLLEKFREKFLIERDFHTTALEETIQHSLAQRDETYFVRVKEDLTKREKDTYHLIITIQGITKLCIVRFDTPLFFQFLDNSQEIEVPLDKSFT